MGEHAQGLDSICPYLSKEVMCRSHCFKSGRLAIKYWFQAAVWIGLGAESGVEIWEKMNLH